MKKWLVAICLTFLIVSCTPQERPQSSPDYQETKQMVIDILKTEDGKKTIQDMMKDPEFKEKIMMTDTDMAQAVNKAISDPKNEKNLQKMFQDPKVAANFAKATQKQHEEMIKQLMKDPEYQK